MVWFYERPDGSLRIETRFDSTTKEYTLQVECPGRPTVIERFGNSAAFKKRVLALERQLEAEQWKQGWRGDITH